MAQPVQKTVKTGTTRPVQNQLNQVRSAFTYLWEFFTIYFGLLYIQKPENTQPQN